MTEDDDHKTGELLPPGVPMPQKLSTIAHVERAIGEIVQRPPSIFSSLPGGAERETQSRRRQVQALTGLVEDVAKLHHSTHIYTAIVKNGATIARTREIEIEADLVAAEARKRQLESLRDSIGQSPVEVAPREPRRDAAWRDRQYGYLDEELARLQQQREALLVELNKAEDDDSGATLNLRHRMTGLQSEIDDLTKRRILIRNEHLDWLKRQED